MKIERVWAVYFSPTGTTKRVTEEAANAAAEGLSLPVDCWDITLPRERKAGKQFGRGDLVIVGTPVYAGRVPNVILKDLKLLQGSGGMAVPVVCYGNRNFDDALVELRDILEDGGFHTIAAGAFIGEHSFSATLAGGRPDEADLRTAREFGRKLGTAAKRIAAAVKPLQDEADSREAKEGRETHGGREMRDDREAKEGCGMWPHPPVCVPGTPRPYRGYYQPRDRKGAAIDIRKVKPLTDDSCDDCGLCAAVCPMGSIDPDNVRSVSGICIKCGACIKKCPKQAKYYDDAGYLYHRTELELGLTRRAEPELFFSF